MASNTGENDQSLRKITDMTRLVSLTVLALHFYFFCYQAFFEWELTSSISDRILDKIARSGLLSSPLKSKAIALGFLLISLVGIKGKKSENVNAKRGFVQWASGLLLYFVSTFLLRLLIPNTALTVLYILVCSAGFLMILSGGSQFSKIIRSRLSNDIFNKYSETFPQFEDRIENEFSINLSAEYRYRNRFRGSWINIINPFRGLLVCGSPGSGKTHFVFRHVIAQHIAKGYGYFGEVDHLIPWQIDHLIIWRPVAEKSCRSSFKNS